MMRKLHASILQSISCVLAFAATCRGAAPATSPPATPLITISPEFPMVVQDLLSDDFKARAAATLRLKQALSELSSQLLLVDQPEIQQRMASALSFDKSFSTWLEELSLQPRSNRERMVQWAFTDDNFVAIAQAYSGSPNDRVTAAKKLASMKEPQAQHIEARLLQDSARQVYIAAMEALWDVNLSPEIIDVLWDRGVAGTFDQYRSHSSSLVSSTITFRGKPIGGVNAIFGMRSQDNDIAIQVLAHCKSPLVSQKIVALLREAAASPRELGARALFQSYGNVGLSALLPVYRDNDVVTALHDLLLVQPKDPPPPRVANPARMMPWWSCRLGALTSLLTLTGQDPELYGMHRFPQFSHVPSVQSPADEDAAVEKFNDWWAHHQSEFAAATTQPSQ